MASLTLRKGDDQVIRGAVTDRDPQSPQPVDITGWTIWFSVKRKYPDADGAAVLVKKTGAGITITDAGGGKFAITLVPADLASIPNAQRSHFRYDVQVRNEHLKIHTLGDGDLTVLGDITVTTIP